MSTSTPPALLSAMQTMLREAIARLVPPIVEQILAAKVGTIIRGGRLQSGALVGAVPAATLPDAATGTVGAVEIDQAPGAGHPVALTVPRLGAANGVAELDAGGKVPVAELPASVLLDPTTTRGDLIAHLAGGTGRLALGGSGQVLTSDGTDAVWQTFAALTNPMTTQDDLIIGGAAGAAARLGKGTSGQVLTVDATSGHLAWDTPSGGGSGTWTKIADSVLSAAAASVTFSSIPGTYRHLKLFSTARTDAAVTSALLQVQPNADTGANYTFQRLHSTGATVAGGANTGQTAIQAGNVPGTGTAAAYAAGAEITLYDYASTVLDKAFSVSAQVMDGTTLFLYRYEGFWGPATVAAITSLILTPGSGNFAAGSVFSLYGLS
jgi:hypothetical protein